MGVLSLHWIGSEGARQYSGHSRAADIWHSITCSLMSNMQRSSLSFTERVVAGCRWSEVCNLIFNLQIISCQLVCFSIHYRCYHSTVSALLWYRFWQTFIALLTVYISHCSVFLIWVVHSAVLTTKFLFIFTDPEAWRTHITVRVNRQKQC